MAKPIINQTQSVLGFLQWQEFEFQPYALNTPTSWTASALPAGVTIDGSTGLISGAAEKAGVYVVAVRATNGDGTSSPVLFTFGIEASSGDPVANAIDIRVDLGTREVTGYAADAAIVTAKYRDNLLFRVQFHRGGAPVAGLDLSELTMVLKEIDGGDVLCTSDAFDDLGDGVFLLHIELSGSDLADALINYEKDDATLFPGLWELEWLAVNATGIGPNPVRGSSRTFAGNVVRDLGQLTP